MNLAPEAPKSFSSKKYYEDLGIELVNHHVYAHYFLHGHICIYKSFLRNFINFSFSVCILAHGSGVRRTQKYFLKNLYEYLRLGFENYHIYSHIFFTTIYPFTCHFLRITQIIQFFMCILNHKSGARSTQNLFLKKHYETSLLRWITIMYSRTIFFTATFAFTDLFV